MSFNHETVLLHETVDQLDVKPDGIYVDATLGGGGHTGYLLSKLTTGHLYSFDQDLTAIDFNEERYRNEIESGKLTLIHTNFRNLTQALAEYDITEIDGILYDLGVSSPQFDKPERGFSYRFDGRLDMRMDQRAELDAYKIVNEWDFNDLVRIFKLYGEEKFSKQIARQIEKIRDQHPIETTTELAEIVKNSIPAPARRTGGFPAKRVFQALRIAVNDELGALESSLEQAIKLLKLHGRISVITFQSLEDRITKHIFQDYSTVDVPSDLPIVPPELKPELKLVTRKPVLPSDEEQDENHRSHSARLRVAEKINIK